MLSASGNHHFVSSGSWGTASNSSLELSDGPGSSSTNGGGKCNRELRVVVVGKAGVGKSGKILHKGGKRKQD